ncbi:unnamed protein product [Gongylonema pulchrum]|uniref:Ribonuclease n=1 Tax=Gongylonema pulchrum TaxID=637853 RepID=A0A183DHH2_9BILA|nr:unnamed protein product [Gongylonema pulchrum]
MQFENRPEPARNGPEDQNRPEGNQPGHNRQQEQPQQQAADAQSDQFWEQLEEIERHTPPPSERLAQPPPPPNQEDFTKGPRKPRKRSPSDEPFRIPRRGEN